MLSWAPLNGGTRRATLIANHQIRENDIAAASHPARHLAAVIAGLGMNPADAVAMMTGAKVSRAGYAHAHHGSIFAAAWCTAGCSNALAVGDPATVETPHAGTINLIVTVNQPLSPAAMAEALQLAVEARVAAMRKERVRSVVSANFATGTGTDCIAIAAPVARTHVRYCGKHTRIGELLGRVSFESCESALRRRS